MKTASTKIQFSLKVTGQEWKSIAAMISEVIGYMGFVYFTSVMDLYSRKDYCMDAFAYDGSQI